MVCTCMSCIFIAYSEYWGYMSEEVILYLETFTRI